MRENRSEFYGKLCLVTGAGQGIGLACTKSLLDQGAHVIACDVTQATLDELQQNLSTNQQQCTTLLPFDLSDPHAILNACQNLQQDNLIPELIITCAGTLHLASILELPYEALNKTLDINLKGTMLLTQQLAKMLVENGRKGAIVAVGSNAADTPRVKMSAYCTSKAGLHMWMQCLGLELAEHGIRCNIVSPGSTRTPMQEQMWNESYGERETVQGNLASHRIGIPLNKIAETKDITNAIEFLLSDKSGHITMHDLRVDGGATF
ncbi:Vibriobactin-specific 2,3-dihydro-2,3-dihydroxybenzoate dehydrogenase [Vibrio jasicida]|uniref:2,3-dihydro-2,3-dihydroxybenzoate dehydrogenase n=1 Tax=Vibrio TaxID=662 RepID=UPI0005AF066E|nr:MULTISPECIES: 2,3-dihydro-2,3-dihydroxybenzoate dehydrogenase [Vibrio]KIP77671.1 2,3-dihydro-2,3-dihydroxybenzoate dehydrogenase [Vibrio harveyi]PMO37337.1 2,3-dihydro-2,3-dihydroxybenzoate dehydrogenase [Vibrio sp. 10N.222.52.B12]CAH1529603.1 Vibriobactin-specific 2,3-dihydro-2,3-dihydroxybenzoate dehydrogenase [Vibrio jasicida]